MSLCCGNIKKYVDILNHGLNQLLFANAIYLTSFNKGDHFQTNPAWPANFQISLSLSLSLTHTHTFQSYSGVLIF
uniref:Uncharacterized protein n=1 Tax=Nelumbo nucifera TaxID=4432 RepID=A0A822YVM7_NELNU|nr:TPA_asm: hypothetical protein HUJ06_006079 [Nelumbo nucifera]